MELAERFTSLMPPAASADLWPGIAARMALPGAVMRVRRPSLAARLAVIGVVAAALAAGAWFASPRPAPSAGAGALPRRELAALGRVLMPSQAVRVDDPLRDHADAWLSALERLAEER
jgi:hypothetical protein